MMKQPTIILSFLDLSSQGQKCDKRSRSCVIYVMYRHQELPRKVEGRRRHVKQPTMMSCEVKVKDSRERSSPDMSRIKETHRGSSWKVVIVQTSDDDADRLGGFLLSVEATQL